jgi:hypothetical protein
MFTLDLFIGRTVRALTHGGAPFLLTSFQIGNTTNCQKHSSAPDIKITTDVILNDVVKPLYSFGSAALLEYAENGSAWQPVPNYNQAVWGDRINDKYLIDRRIGEEVENTVSRYLSDAILGRSNLEEDWGLYIEKLNDIGVAAYVAYYNGE